MEKLLYSKGQDCSIDSSCLQNTVRKLVSNLCETLIMYRTQLRIEGTVGITIDDERVIVLHFGENIGKPCLSDDIGSHKMSNMPDSHIIHNYDSGTDESRSELFTLQKQSSLVENVVSPSSLSPVVKGSTPSANIQPGEEIKVKVQHEAAPEMDSESSPRSVKSNYLSVNSASHSEVLDSLLCTSKPNESGGQNSFSGRSELQGATLLDMTTDILSNLFNSSSKEAAAHNCPERGPIFEQNQSSKLRHGSAIEALRQIYCKQVKNQGKETTTQYQSEVELHPNTRDHLMGLSPALKGKSVSAEKREHNQNQVLLRELLFQKTSPAAHQSGMGFSTQQSSSKRRRIGEMQGNVDQFEKSNATTSFSDLLSQRNNEIGNFSENAKPNYASFGPDDSGGGNQRDDSSFELGQSDFSARVPLDQDTDNSKYRFSQLLFSLVDSRRQSAKNSSATYPEQASGNSAPTMFKPSQYPDTFMSESDNSIKQEVDDMEFERIEKSSFTG